MIALKDCQNTGKKLFLYIFLPALLTVLSSCAAFQKYLDNSGMESSYESIIKDYNPGSPVEFSRFVKNFSLAQSTSPFDPGTPEQKPIGDWELEPPKGVTLIQEKLVFHTPASGLTHSNDKLVLYVYRQGEINGSRVLLFAPGMGVSNFALMFLKDIFTEIIKRGYTLVLYVPPYHLDRIQPGKDRGEGFFTADNERNIRMIAACASEVRTAMRYLKSKGALDVAAWGGSLGASFLLLSAEHEQYTHLTVMIPVIDLNSALLDNPEMKRLKDRLLADGFSGEVLRQAYGMVSPMDHQTLTPPDKMLILFARYDQLTPMTALEAYRKSHGNPRVIIYDRSHATILTASDLYDDYAAQLDEWNKSVR
jgi:hypothetical protein